MPRRIDNQALALHLYRILIGVCWWDVVGAVGRIVCYGSGGGAHWPDGPHCREVLWCCLVLSKVKKDCHASGVPGARLGWSYICPTWRCHPVGSALLERFLIASSSGLAAHEAGFWFCHAFLTSGSSGWQPNPFHACRPASACPRGQQPSCTAYQWRAALWSKQAISSRCGMLPWRGSFVACCLGGRQFPSLDVSLRSLSCSKPPRAGKTKRGCWRTRRRQILQPCWSLPIRRAPLQPPSEALTPAAPRCAPGSLPARHSLQLRPAAHPVASQRGTHSSCAPQRTR